MSQLIQRHINLQAMNTMRLPAEANFYCYADSKAKIMQALQFAKNENLKTWVLGGGSNIILTGDFDGLVLHIANKGIELQAETEKHVLVSVAAGENWDGFLQYCLDQKWYGLENLAIIPGTVGAAPIQNIGAYGQEVADCIETVTVVDCKTLEEKTLEKEACDFTYRDSIFRQQPGQYIVNDVCFSLNKVFEPELSYKPLADYLNNNDVEKSGLDAMQLREAVIAIRNSKLPQPKNLPNTGSFFKNPVIEQQHYERLAKQWPELPAYPLANNTVKLPAGWLIEQAGWKGKSLGPVGMYEQQALVLVNHKDGTYQDVSALAMKVGQDVMDMFGITLEQEPLLV